MIPVTKPFLPPINDYQNYLVSIWDKECLTNNGYLLQELESKLAEYLKVGKVLFVGNGTVALQIAIKALKLKRKIITTPFSYVATASSIFWEGCEPVFADIDEDTLNIDPNKIETEIDEDTSAILATHVFGNPCQIDVIKKIADKHKLKVIYDAAHCFGTLYKGKSIFDYGDISTSSFHATKIFHSVEGGAIFSKNTEIQERVFYMRNFGHDGPERFNGVGINGKNSELHAAIGLCNLKYIDEVLKTRKVQFEYYLNNLNNESIRIQKHNIDGVCNYSYFPAIFKSEEITLAVKKKLEQNSIYTRRYFYPSLNKLNYLKNSSQPISESIARRILCLPLYHTLSLSEQQRIIKLINDLLKSK